MESVSSNLAAVREQIAEACRKAGRSEDEVTLIAVSKTKSAAAVREAWDAGQREFGESYVQEFLEKLEAPELSGLPLDWHFIGHLQSNKVRQIVGKAAMIHGIDKVSTAEELSKRAEQHGIDVDFLLEVNTSREGSKYGLDPGSVLQAAEECFALPNVRLRGLMTIASPDPVEARREFAELRQTLEKLRQNAPDPTLLTELSMGMSGDFEEAILEGATMIRIGTAIFGWR
ncbi:YggS family pyridoxal phosphate-dependent enzyme [Chlorobaculum thiosulfatiphilum]|uniref:Pyridoxal phosphate homeostasis protein n=1 Tax=Chlorobaculum thiosulfatiphilum TaxID=115852 RepID=A0A5C4S9M8_CHLTI|nr:YggS family pyridoxal phosphate-dependent enzyme [Chlorobaculum thiosulfatiphilum]TNJ39858.1 YggS family pyridoxal phosphate-dependent enzyme [Chlorobaculum thiosulfatiphilum]